MNRCFIALEVGEKAKEQCQKIILQLKNSRFHAKWVEVENFHITLFFLGVISNEKMEETSWIVKKLNYNPFHLMIDRIGFFQKYHKPSTLWLGIEKCQEIEEIYLRMKKELEEIFHKKFREQFIPHLTLGRIKKAPKDWMSKIETVTVETVETGDIVFSLKRSTLTENGPVYETIATKGV